jgi:hypothetical protein
VAEEVRRCAPSLARQPGQPQDLAAGALASLDVVIALGSPDPSAHVVELTAAVADAPRARVAELLQGPTGRAVLAWRQHARRRTPRRR